MTTAELGNLLKALSDPTRLAIFDRLMQGVQCNCELGDQLKMPMNLVSHHLKVLRDAGLIDAERDKTDARWVYYSVNQKAVEQLGARLAIFFDVQRIQPRQPVCGPRRRAKSTSVARRRR